MVKSLNRNFSHLVHIARSSDPLDYLIFNDFYIFPLGLYLCFIKTKEVFYPCSIKTREVLGNPSLMPKIFSETRETFEVIINQDHKV